MLFPGLSQFHYFLNWNFYTLLTYVVWGKYRSNSFQACELLLLEWSLKVLFFEPGQVSAGRSLLCTFKHTSSCILIFFFSATCISSIHLVPLDRFFNLVFLCWQWPLLREKLLYIHRGEVASETLKVLQSFIRSGVKWFMCLYFCVMLPEQRKKKAKGIQI